MLDGIYILFFLLSVSLKIDQKLLLHWKKLANVSGLQSLFYLYEKELHSQALNWGLAPTNFHSLSALPCRLENYLIFTAQWKSFKF